MLGLYVKMVHNLILPHKDHPNQFRPLLNILAFRSTHRNFCSWSTLTTQSTTWESSSQGYCLLRDRDGKRNQVLGKIFTATRFRWTLCILHVYPHYTSSLSPKNLSVRGLARDSPLQSQEKPCLKVLPFVILLPPRQTPTYWQPEGHHNRESGVNIPLARGRTLTSGFSYIEGTNFKDEIQRFSSRDVRLQHYDLKPYELLVNRECFWYNIILYCVSCKNSNFIMSCAGLAFNLDGKKIIIFIEHVVINKHSN
jgi:hypothetical protein